MLTHRINLRWMVMLLSNEVKRTRQALLLAGYLLTTIIVLSLTMTAQAQTSSAAGHGVMKPGQHVPFSLQSEPPALTPDQERLREEAMRHSNLPGPPLPEAPAVQGQPATPSVPSTAGKPGAQLTAPEEPPVRPQNLDKPGAPSTFRYFRTSAQAPYSTRTSTIAETQAGNAGNVVFMTGNWFASYSTNGGATFSFVNPYTQFPSLDGGFCCDQTAIYDRTRDLMIWQLQYSYSATTMKGSYRTAFARASAVSTGGWCYYDWNPRSFGLGAGLWLDYPHVALSNNFVWYTANVYNASDAWQRTLIWRIPLNAVSTCSGFNFNYFVVADRFNFTPTQNAANVMYWGSHNNTGSIRIYRWDEASGTIFWNDVTITTWPKNLPYRCPGPDGLNWCGRAPNDGRIQTGWVANGVIGFMWNASQGSRLRLSTHPRSTIHAGQPNADQSAYYLASKPCLAIPGDWGQQPRGHRRFGILGRRSQLPNDGDPHLGWIFKPSTTLGKLWGGNQRQGSKRLGRLV